ncbi:MAG TPA: SDR family NAD(P)-dependent oxidoreductase [Acidimicrobiia bacterium]|nr:SDR family NAD(P)-dependent oxidoreductase [Acidimicrobiia bacterium]
MAELDGKRALVTGGAQGLGKAIAALFIERGAKVVIADIDEAGAKLTADELGESCRSVRCDVTSLSDLQAAVQATVDAFGGLDIMVNNAGIEVVKPLFHHTEEEFDAIYNINVKGVWLGMQAALAALPQPGGVIVNMASLAGLGGVPLFGAYSASKAGVVQLTRAAATELKPTGIRINAVCPAFIATAMVDRLAPIVTEIVGVPFDDLAAMKQGRVGTPEEVAEMVAFLASDDASFCTGGAYVLDGGLQAGML